MVRYIYAPTGTCMYHQVLDTIEDKSTKINLRVYCMRSTVARFMYRIAGNFRIFRTLHPLYKNKNCEILNMRKFISFVSDL